MAKASKHFALNRSDEAIKTYVKSTIQKQKRKIFFDALHAAIDNSGVGYNADS